ncbi:MAG: hypothetical protein Q7S66_04080 [bacterium]|nr:hypothetical protein [bacterium]
MHLLFAAVLTAVSISLPLAIGMAGKKPTPPAELRCIKVKYAEVLVDVCYILTDKSLDCEVEAGDCSDGDIPAELTGPAQKCAAVVSCLSKDAVDK